MGDIEVKKRFVAQNLFDVSCAPPNKKGAG